MLNTNIRIALSLVAVLTAVLVSISAAAQPQVVAAGSDGTVLATTEDRIGVSTTRVDVGRKTGPTLARAPRQARKLTPLIPPPDQHPAHPLALSTYVTYTAHPMQ